MTYRANLHVYPTTLDNQNRLFKEAKFTLRKGILDRVVVVGLWQSGRRKEERLESGLEIIRVKTAIHAYKRTFLIRKSTLLRKILAAFSLIQYAISVLRQSIVVKPSHVSCHYAAMLPLSWLAARLSGATLEYLPHELETQRTGLKGIGKVIDTWIERRFIHKARNVVVVCDPIRDWYEKAYGLKNLHVVRNLPEKDAVEVRPIPGGGFRDRFDIPDGAKVFIYQGLFSAGRGIEALIETFSALDSQWCHLVLMGYGEGSYQAMIDQATLNQSNIHFQPAVASEWIVSYSASADVGIFISERASLSYRYALPNKFFEWAHAGLPILVSDNLEYQADLLNEGGFGWSAPLEELTEAVQRIAETDLTPFARNAELYAAAAIWDEDAKAFAEVYRAQVA